MNNKKIFNDPVYGLVSFPFESLYILIEHPYFQRLRRIGQVGLAHLVYPGALHTRFHHALGALHLMTRAISTLREKSIEIADEEAEAVCIAILLHDIGHGPFSHALEGLILPTRHEVLSLAFMNALNREMNGRLNLAIRIFNDDYPKHFLHELVSSQLDMDRMDYLNRDSFYTGVAEGVIGYDRIIKMINVVNDRLVVEEKGIYSIEKFLVARRIMYWQVYLHKTCLAAEQMLIAWYQRLKSLYADNKIHGLPSYWIKLLEINSSQINDNQLKNYLEHYAQIDDIDFMYHLKKFRNHEDRLLNYLSGCLLHRKLFKIKISKEQIPSGQMSELQNNLKSQLKLPDEDIAQLIFKGKESNLAYSQDENEIMFLQKSGKVVPMSDLADHLSSTKTITRHFVCYPRT